MTLVSKAVDCSAGSVALHPAGTLIRSANHLAMQVDAAGVRTMVLSLQHNTWTLWLPRPAVWVDGNMSGADSLRYQIWRKN